MSTKTNKDRQKKWATDYTAKSTKFSACMFLGFGKFDTREADSLEAARRLREQMLLEYADKNFGRGVSIYAITPDNQSILVE